eukprot:487334-Prymnesium_polylepis.1
MSCRLHRCQATNGEGSRRRRYAGRQRERVEFAVCHKRIIVVGLMKRREACWCETRSGLEEPS